MATRLLFALPALIKLQTKRATEEDNVQQVIDKYFFLRSYDLQDEDRTTDAAKLFFDKYTGVYNNVRIEKRYHLSQWKLWCIINIAEKEHDRATGNGALMSSTPEKLEHIVHILTLLGLKHSQDCGTVTTISDKTIEYLTVNRLNLIKFFKSDKINRSKDVTTDKDLAQKLLNSIFLNWSGMHFCKVRKDSNEWALCAKRDNSSAKGIVFYDHIHRREDSLITDIDQGEDSLSSDNPPAIDPCFILPPVPKPPSSSIDVAVNGTNVCFVDSQPLLLGPLVECH